MLFISAEQQKLGGTGVFALISLYFCLSFAAPLCAHFCLCVSRRIQISLEKWIRGADWDQLLNVTGKGARQIRGGR